MKKIPYAIGNYEEIISDNCYFVDKTRFITELERYKVPVFLRPRRFGKSLWCSTLECYYDINRKNKFNEFFGHTDIGKNPTPSRNSLMVMRFNFSVMTIKKDVEGLQKSFDFTCRGSMGIFLKRYEAFFKEKIVYSENTSASDLLDLILNAVIANHLPPVYIIIDEYDNFTNQLLTTHQDLLYKSITTGDSFLRSFYKTIKAGVETLAIARVFITGVLPVTIDDLTSGFNIAQIITLEEPTLSMMGFTQKEVDVYLDDIFSDNQWDSSKRKQVGEELKAHYNGYSLLPNATTLYNSTICNFYLSSLVINKGKIPTDRIDHNLRVDINWLRRLAGGEEQTLNLLEKLMFDGSLPFDLSMLSSQFNMSQFFQERFFALSLYYLGMLSFKDEYSLTFPNLTVKTLFTEYFNEVEEIEVSLGYTDMFRAFLNNNSFENLFAGYWDEYVGQIPAQAFDKANENFFRTTFYELCTRYLGRKLMIAIEVNHPSGRSDWEAIGRADTPFENKAFVIEFKHFTREKAKQTNIKNLKEPLPAEIKQVTGYATDLKNKFPNLTIFRSVVYTISGEGFKFFELDLG